MPGHTTTSIETATGRVFDYRSPRVHLTDMVVHMSRVNRFAGGMKIGVDHYSVLEHSVLVHDLIVAYVPGESRDLRRDLRKAALLHDAHEAYTGDLVTPFQNALGPPLRNMIAWLVMSIDELIAEDADIDPSLFRDDLMRFVDAWALRVEAQRLMVSGGRDWDWDIPGLPHIPADLPDGVRGPVGWNPGMAQSQWWMRWQALGGRMVCDGCGVPLSAGFCAPDCETLQ